MAKQRYVIGIDGGHGGAMVVLDSKGNIVEKTKMPVMQTTDTKNEYDCQGIIRFLQKYPEATVVLEKAHPMPKLGVSSAFSFGRGFGTMIGILAGLKMRYHIVHAKTWQKFLFADQPSADTKMASKIIAQRLFPAEDFRPTERSKNLSDGLTDAACIAYYGHRYL